MKSLYRGACGQENINGMFYQHGVDNWRMTEDRRQQYIFLCVLYFYVFSFEEKHFCDQQCFKPKRRGHDMPVCAYVLSAHSSMLLLLLVVNCIASPGLEAQTGGHLIRIYIGLILIWYLYIYFQNKQ